MAKSTVIILLSIAIVLQNTCLMGAAGQSILFRALNKGCRMSCHSGCPAQGTSDNGVVKSHNKDMSQGGRHVICYFQFKAEDMAKTIAVLAARQAYLCSECQLKHPFLAPPIKPPGTVFPS